MIEKNSKEGFRHAIDVKNELNELHFYNHEMKIGLGKTMALYIR